MMEENKEILHETLKRGSVEVPGKDLPTYPLPFKLIKTDRFSLGEIEKGGKCLNVILLGLTGSGKSLLLEVIGNYGLGVDCWDPYRFQVKKDEHTEKITSYTFSTRYKKRLPHPVTIIDTPGFQNAPGEGDQKLMGDIRNFIHSNQMPIHAVAYVIPGSQGRLTAEQKTLMRNMPNALGEDEEGIERIPYLFCTFADSKRLPILQSVKEAKLSYKKAFAVNSSAYFVDEKGLSIEENKENREEAKGGSINEMLWKMTTESVREFLEDIQCNSPLQDNLLVQVNRPIRVTLPVQVNQPIQDNLPIQALKPQTPQKRKRSTEEDVDVESGKRSKERDYGGSSSDESDPLLKSYQRSNESRRNSGESQGSGAQIYSNCSFGCVTRLVNLGLVLIIIVCLWGLLVIILL